MNFIDGDEMKNISKFVLVSIFILMITFKSSYAQTQMVTFFADQYKSKDTIKILDSIQISYLYNDEIKKRTLTPGPAPFELPLRYDFAIPSDVGTDIESKAISIDYNQGFISVRSYQEYSQMSIKIYNYMGQLIQSKSINNPANQELIPFSEFSDGVYFIVVSADDQVKSFNIQKIASQEVHVSFVTQPRYSDYCFISFKSGFKPDTIFRPSINSRDTIRFIMKKYPLEQYYTGRFEISGIIMKMDDTLIGYDLADSTIIGDNTNSNTLDNDTICLKYIYSIVKSGEGSFKYFERDVIDITYKILFNPDKHFIKFFEIDYRMDYNLAATVGSYSEWGNKYYKIQLSDLPTQILKDGTIQTNLSPFNDMKKIKLVNYEKSAAYRLGNGGGRYETNYNGIHSLLPDAKLKITLKPE